MLQLPRLLPVRAARRTDGLTAAVVHGAPSAVCVLNREPAARDYGLVCGRRRELAHEGLHENRDDLSKKTLDYHRAVVSLIEELEAVDWYNQRVDVCDDDELKEILEHNRDEEKEHAAMLLEWVRRRDDAFSHELKDYLFTEARITELEEGH